MKLKSSIVKRLNILIICMVIVSVLSIFGIMEVSLRTLQKNAKSILTNQLITSTSLNVDEQVEVSNQTINNLINIVESSALFAGNLYENPDSIIPTEVKTPDDYEGLDVEGKTEFYYSTFDGVSNQKPEVLKEVEILSGLKPNFEAIKKQYSKIEVLSVYTLSGVLIGYDENVSYKIGTGGYNPEELGKEYYIVPKETGKTYITNPYLDAYGRGLVVTISTPIFKNGDMVGILAADALIDDIYDIVCTGGVAVDGGYKVLLNQEGELLCAENMTEETTSEDVLKEGTEDIVAAVKDNDKGYLYTAIDGVDVCAMYDTMECGWNMIEILPVSGMLASVNRLEDIISFTNILAIVVSVALLIIMIIAAYIFCTRIASPISLLTKKVEAITGDNLDFESDIHTGDEIELLSSKFKQATERMKEYVDNIARITAEKERISAELNVATKIQADMLPRIFPKDKNIECIDIYATMDPAKEVGGDFYDFFMVDDKHMAIVVADVSGKGVPAALFMVIAKTLIKVRTTPGSDIGQVFMEVNNLLCEGNENSLFVTVFEGVLNVENGEFYYCNAGHEQPFICKKDESFSVYEVKPAFVLAGMEDMVYKSGMVKLEPGDRLFEYSDGVTEATRADNELFGMERLEEALNIDPRSDLRKLLKTVRNEVDTFVDGAPQFDDITMLCMEFKHYGEKIIEEPA